MSTDSITTETTNAWREELGRIADDVQDAEAKQALAALGSALQPYFDRPAQFKSMMGKIQMVMLTDEQQRDLTESEFASLEDLKASLPEGIEVSVL